MTEIYLVRHAEAEGNVYRRMHGQYDSLITPNGYRQIEALQRRFAPIHVDACYASDLTRTSITAGAIYRPKGLPLQRDKRFREVNVGRWEDVPFGYLDRFETDRMLQFNRDPVHWHVEGAERYDDYTSRFLDGMEEAVSANPGKTIVIVAHGCVLRGVLMRLFSDHGHCDNTAVTHLFYENGQYTCDYCNDNSHLSPEISTLARQSWWRSNGSTQDFNLWYQPLTDSAAFVSACRDIETLTGETASEQAVLLQQFDSLTENGEVLAAMLGQTQIGTVAVKSSSVRPDAAVAFLFHLDQAYRGKRFGTQLLGAAVSYARRQGKTVLMLQTSERNTAAAAFYRHMGFEETGAVPGKPEQRIFELNLDTRRFVW